MGGWTDIGRAKNIYYSVCPCGHIMLGWPEYPPREGWGRRDWRIKFKCPRCGTDRAKFKRTRKPFELGRFIEVFELR